MLEQIPHPADHVVAIRAGGTVTAQELQQAIDLIEAAKKRYPKVSMVAELDDLRWMTLTALLRDLGYGLTQIGELDHYHRAAVITDKEWIKHVAHLEDRLVKKIEIRTFSHKERDAAMAWVAALPPGADSASEDEPERDGYHGA
ncbi:MULTISPECIES: STAS/SEC14 domain-containing protein [Halomonas]|uniref:STAS/SEC14 domain-containing protein n=1 Tax=Halomonas TaxID=2745 RepID=UPI001C97FEDF|nr:MULTISPECIES: STAS/SEC14 domain-containing protein [Halomonas]MBY6207919.1 STAS/SEC14 domain-containing protein [Halomonas sp. DP3Y7-2]MBY6228728.1 STAS/SEC14 domain-containing protein [Halomonas sp. DP3Y7-1]MCA0917288.1 STAS/SEC14 domain-containing protein [Halomonas denitrificans]